MNWVVQLYCFFRLGGGLNLYKISDFIPNSKKQCFGSISFWYGSGSLNLFGGIMDHPALDLTKNLEITTFVFLFFLSKLISQKKLFCYFWGKYFCMFNKSLVFLKMYMIFLWFLWEISMILPDICYRDFYTFQIICQSKPSVKYWVLYLPNQ